MFVTIASQRPADISPTIVSQLHNFFIHRLANDRDLFIIDNTISTLDALSRSLIPGLSQGCCVATGTAFDLPLVIQVDRLPSDKQPASEDVDLEKLGGRLPLARSCDGGVRLSQKGNTGMYRPRKQFDKVRSAIFARAFVSLPVTPYRFRCWAYRLPRIIWFDHSMKSASSTCAICHSPLSNSAFLNRNSLQLSP
ncbi:hypothetical protein B7L17_029725 [Burkholderia cenocepacia]|uniref:hypothetical protein n=1 Tax=Burkholderia cenocepacia TaxID=95486 RepID=UPI002238C692|nr:hypothetical protein [Burkholderia cenocepacia]MCW5120957.1 hypothetical protein [Burkholderia cenocepacia]MCW5134464.1 hypothetical protein [Burkholderia cenocepacia]MCW5177232.1 hypothetical protein [Burkholderia cenocepacia]